LIRDELLAKKYLRGYNQCAGKKTWDSRLVHVDFFPSLIKTFGFEAVSQRLYIFTF